MNDDIVHSLTERLEVVVDRGKELINDERVHARVEEIREITEETVRKHPVKSVLVGLAIGFLIGKAFSEDD